MTFQRGVLAAVLAVIALALVLDSQEPYREPREASPPPPASLTAAKVKQIARSVERIRDLRFERPVDPLLVGRDEAVRLQQEASAEERGSLEADEAALKLLGLMRPGESLSGAIAAVEGEQVLGFYDDTRKRLVVVRDRQPSRPLLEITLAHELVHALEDQRFGLLTHGAVSDDQSLAETTLAEGTATTVMAEYAIDHFGIDDALSLFGAADTDTNLPRYIEHTLTFPYDSGVEFVETFRGASGSWKAIDNLIRFRRPSTVEQVLHADKYAMDEGAVPIRLPDLGLALGEEWRRFGVSSVSELDLRELFELVGRSPNRRAAAGWGGGRFELWRRGGSESCPGPCVERDVGMMALAWDSPRDRGEGEGALAAAFRKGLTAQPVGDQGAVRQWSSRGGVIAMAGAGVKTAIVLAPNPRVARRLAAVAF